MKYLFILPLVFAYSVLLSQNQIKYEIRGTIKNYKPGQKVYFLRVKTGHALDSLSLIDSTFVFKDSAEISNEPELNYIESYAHVFVDHSGKGIDFTRINVKSFPDAITVYLEPGTTRVTIIDSAIKAVVIPPTLNSGHYTLDSIYTARYKKLSAAINETNSRRIQKKDAFSFFENQRRTFDAGEKSDLLNFVKTHPASPVSLYILKHDEAYYPDYNKLAPYFYALSAALKNTAFGKQYADMLAGLRRTRLGTQAPDFTMADTNGKKVPLSAFKGKYVLVDFWASWCKPCREENPSIVKAYNQFGGKNFIVLGVSLDKTKEAWLKAITDDNLIWTQVSDLNFWNNAAAQLYSVKAIPQNFLLSPQGNIIAKNLFGEQLTKKLKELLDKGTSEAR